MSSVSLEQARDLVRRYYDHNTPSFEKYGQGATTIHRAVWGPGVRSRGEAFRYLDQLVTDDLARLGRETRVLDLGCGVGGSLLHLAARLPELQAVGVTLSPVQAGRAGELIAAAGLSSRIACLEADFVALPEELGSFDLAFAIESFVHCPDAGAFFASAARHIETGGRLIVCDDFQSRAAGSADEERWIERIRDGWMGHGLCSVAGARQEAEAHGLRLVEDLDLTPYLELRRPRDRALTLLLWLGGPFRIQSPLWNGWRGGDALQYALVNGLVGYRFLRFEKLA